MQRELKMVLRKGASASRCQYSLRSVASKKLYFETSGIKLEATTTNPFTNHVSPTFSLSQLTIRRNATLLPPPQLLSSSHLHHHKLILLSQRSKAP